MNESTEKVSHGRGRVALYLLFFVSGVAALLYQTVWIRRFGTVLGGTTLSMSVVVSTFMGGIAVGSAALGRLADRVNRPLRLYAGIELAIATAALVLNQTEGLRMRMINALIDSPSLEGTVALRAVIVALWLGVPCFLIGGTLPVMVRFIVRHLGAIGQEVGALYVVNTLGAAVGAIANIYLVELLGLTGTTLVAAGINVTVALSALVIDRLTPPSAPPEPAAAPPSDKRSLAIVPAAAFFISGLASLVLEMGWSRLSAGFLFTGVLNVSMSLALILVGFAIGGAASAGLADRTSAPRRLTAVFFAAAAFVAALGMSNIELLTAMGASDVYAPTPTQFGGLLGLVFAPSVLMGATFPLLTRVLVTSHERLGTQLGGYYALNTVGTVLGGLLAPFWLIPTIGTSLTIVLAIGLQLVVAVMLAASETTPATSAVQRFGVGVAAIVTAVVLYGERDAYHEQIVAQAKRTYPSWAEEVAFREGVDSTVVLWTVPEGARQTVQNDDNIYRVQVNASTLVAFDTNETKLMAHLPLMAVPNPKRALVICFGVGNTFRSALSHDIDVDVVDINPGMPPLARIHQKNPSATFDDPKGHIYINDGRNFLQLSRQPYDMITLDPAPPLWGMGVNNIQSREFFQLISDHLSDDGVAEAWLLADLEGDFPAMLRAFREAFPHVAVFKGASYLAFHVLGSKKPLRFSQSRLNDLFIRPRIRADLGEKDIKFFSPEMIRGLYVTDEQGVDQVVANVRPVTDDWPILEYRMLRGTRPRPDFAFPTYVVKPLRLVP